ncbi:MAG TPA: VWA domain-containing protein [Candidatus Koribacter sp.]|jgi:tetratricopeptide (TPR) repeat protein
MSNVSKKLVCVLLFCVAAAAQTSLDAYTNAVRQSRISDRMAGMERFLGAYPNSQLRTDALEILVWDSIESLQREQARARANDLLKIDPQNALALGIVAQARAEVAGRNRREAQAAFQMAQDGIRAYPHLRQPEGITNSEFILIQRQLVSILDGEAGLGYLDERNYAAAHQYLQQAVAIRPQDPRYLYGLALALLDGKDRSMQQEGYLYLARTVNLTQGTPAGQQIAAFAAKKFETAGGTAAGWNGYLASATVPGMNIRPATVPTAEQPAIVAKANPPANIPNNEPATESAPASIPQPVFRREYVARTSPVSMGILLQTEHLNKENRKQILDALSDMVRHLRNDDEVFIMAYGKKLDFEQDLTGNPKLLEEAMDQIKPESGAALLDAVAFAAGHLERIATNKNRLLLVISDGRNTPSKDNPLSLSQKLNTVRVDCIGLDVDGDAGRRQLESLAAYSGGQVTFANDTTQLRTAAVQMAESIGIEFPN